MIRILPAYKCRFNFFIDYLIILDFLLYAETRNRIEKKTQQKVLLSDKKKLYTIYKPYYKKKTNYVEFKIFMVSSSNFHGIIGKYVRYRNYCQLSKVLLNRETRQKINISYSLPKRIYQDADFRDSLFSFSSFKSTRLFATVLFLIGCNPVL